MFIECRFKYLDFCEILHSNRENGFLKAHEVIGKNVNQGKKWYHFFWCDPKSQLDKSIPKCGPQHKWHFCVVFVFLCWLVVLRNFYETFVVHCFFHKLLNIKCCWELAQIVLRLGLWILMKSHFAGATLNWMPFLSWLEFILKIQDVPYRNSFLNTCMLNLENGELF